MMEFNGALTKFAQIGIAQLIGAVLVCSSQNAQAGVVGYIDRVTTQSALGPEILGWACDSGVASSANVHLYSGGPAGQGGVFVKSAKADAANEAAVNSACSTPTGTRHRFRIPLTSAQLLQFGGQPIYIHGISLSGGTHNLLMNSGQHAIPQATIKGNIEAVAFAGTDLKISGWACQYTIAQSINVDLYGGGPAGSGTKLASTSANLSPSAATDNACGSTGVPHRFMFTLTSAQYRSFTGRPIYIHGIHVAGQVPNAAINGSGITNFPNVVISTLSQKLAGVAQGSDVTIASNERVIIDRNANLGILKIQGQLACPATGTFELLSQGILVEGTNSLFECGNSVSRFMGQLTIGLKPGRDLYSGHSMGERAIAAHGGGTIRLIGDGRRAGWRRIVSSINPGTSTVVLSSAASDWQVGDRIVVGPTSFKFNEADERIITAIDATKRVVTVDQPFSFAHNGKIQPYSNGAQSWTLDERAEIANLTRNIRIQPTGADADLDTAQIGGHMMVMSGGFGFIDGVEFVRMGQMGRLGRYPFHWHLAGRVPGQYIRNSSIRNSYQRCLSVHGTHEAGVINNVCYNHFGHGFFLENGSETQNSIIGNLSMVSKRVPAAKALLISDVTTSDPSRFSASSGFWISNPDNIVRGNVASGAQGTGIWMSFSQSLRCNGANHCEVGGTFPGYDIHPARTATRVFSDNIAHSADVGMNWDGAPDGALTGNPLNPLDRVIVASHYFYDAISNPASPGPVFERCAVFKNRRTGIYTRGNTMEFRHLIAADNADSLFFAFNQIVRDSLVVGLSPFNTAADLEYLRTYLRTFQPIHGVRLYDGPFDLVNVHFADFATTPLTVGGIWEATPVPFYAIGGFGRFLNSVRGLTFSPMPLRKFDFDSQERASNYWLDSILTSAIRDLDGSLTGRAGDIVRPDRAFNLDSSCIGIPGERAVRCRYKMGTINFGLTGFENNTYNTLNFRIQRDDGPFMEWDGRRMFNKAGLIAGNRHRYHVTFAPGAIPAALRVTWNTDTPEMSPVIEMSGLKATCNLGFATQVTTYGAMIPVYSFVAGSLAQLESLTSMATPVAVFRDPYTGRTFMRFYSNAREPLFTSANAAEATTHRLDFGCP